MENLDRKATVWQEPFVDVFRTFKVDQWKTAEAVGSVASAIDNAIGRKVLRITGSVPAANYVRIPKSRSASLGLVGRYVYVVMKAPRRAGQVYVIHLDVRTQDGLTLRISLSPLYTGLKVSPTVIQVPTGELAGGKWSILTVDAAGILDAHSTRVYHSLKAVQLCSTLLVRNVYTSFNLYSPHSLPRDIAMPLRPGRSWDELYGYLRLPGGPVEPGPAEYGTATELELELSRPLPLPHARMDDDGVPGPRPHMAGAEDDADASASAPVVARAPAALGSGVRRARRGGGGDDRRSAAKALMATVIPRASGPPPSEDSIIPASSPLLTLESVMGVSPGAAVFSSDASEVVYAAGSCVIAASVGSVPVEQRVFCGHTANVVDFDVGSTLMVSGQGGHEAVLRVWDFESGLCLGVLVGHARDVVSVCLSPDDALVAGVGKAKSGKVKIVLWDVSGLSVTEGGGIASVVGEVVVDPDVGVLKFSPFGDSRLVSCGLNNIRFWRVKGGVIRSCPVALGEHTGHEFTDVAFEGGMVAPAVGGRVEEEQAVIGRRVFVASSQGMVFQIAYGSVELEAIYQLHNGPIRSIGVVDGYCVTGSDDHFLRLWPLDFSDFFLEAEHEAPVTSVAISYDCLRLVAATASGTIGTLDILSQTFTTFVRSHTGTVGGVAVAPAGGEVATAGTDGTIRVWSLESREQLVEFATGSDAAVSLAYHPSHAVLAVGFASGWFRVFDLATTSLLHEYKQHTSAIGRVAFAASADAVFSASVDGTVVKYAVHSAYHPTQFVAHFCPCAATGATPLAVASDGATVAYAGPSTCVVTIADAETLRPIHTLDVGSPVHAIHFSQAAAHELIIATVDASVYRADASRGELLTCVAGVHQAPISAVDVSANGQYLVTGGHDGFLRVRDYYSRARPYSQSFVCTPGWVADVAFSADGAWLVAVGSGGGVFVWRFHGDTSPEFREWSEAQLEALARGASGGEGASADADEASEAGGGDEEADGVAAEGSGSGSGGRSASVDDDDPAFGDVELAVQTVFRVAEGAGHLVPPALAEERYEAPEGGAALAPRVLLGYTGSMYGGGGRNAVWCESGGYIAYASGCGVVVEDVGSKAQTHLWGHTGPVSVIAVSGDGSMVASGPGTGDGDGAARVHVWSVADASCMMSLAYHEAGVGALSFSPDGRYLVSVGVYAERSVCVWDLGSCELVGSCVTEHPQHEVVWMPSATEAVFVTVGAYSMAVFEVMEGDDGSAGVSGPAYVRLPASLQATVFTAAAFDVSPRRASRVARRLYVGTYDGSVAVFNMSASPAAFCGAWKVDEQGRQVTTVTWRHDMVFTGGVDGTIKAWAVPDDPRAAEVGGALVESLKVGEGPVVAYSASASGDGALVGTGDSNLWFVNWPELASVRLLSAHGDGVTGVAFAKDGELIVSGGLDGSVRLWSHGRGAGPWEGAVQFQVASRGVGVTCVGVSEVRGVVVAGYTDGCVRVFDLGEMCVAGVHKVFADAAVTALALGGVRDGVCIVGSGGGEVAMVDVGSGGVMRVIGEHRGAAIDCVAVSGLDPSLWLVGARDRRVSVWRSKWRSDTVAMVDWLTFAAPVGGVEGGVKTVAAFSPVEPEMIVYSGYGELPTLLMYSLVHEEVVRSVALKAGGWPTAMQIVGGATPVVIIGSGDRVVSVVDYWEGVFQDFVGHSGGVGAVAVAPGGSGVVTGGGCGGVGVWEINVE